MENSIHIYCDGACSGNPGPGGWAAVLIFPEGTVREMGGGERPTTNNRMEMSAAIAALIAVKDRPEPVKLYTDSALLVNGISSWIHGWKRKDWVTAGGAPVVNRDLWESLDALAQFRKGRLAWVHVKGHAGQEINERCDVIAVAFSKNVPMPLYNGPAVGCGYSLLPPGAEHLHKPAAPRGKASGGHPSSSVHRSSKSKAGSFYISLVHGQFERHATWPQCQARVNGASGARFKKVSSPQEEAEVLKLWGL